MTEKRFNSYCDNENIRIRIDDDIKNKEVFHIYFAELDDAPYCKSKLNSILDLLNALHEENMSLRGKHTQMIIIMKDVVTDLKRMDTYRYAEHLEKIANIHFLSEKELME